VSSHPFAYAQKRRSTRIEQAMPLLVQGVGALREPYQEQVSTLSISCHGCAYQSKHEVIQGESVYLDVRPSNDGSAGCSSRARVKWVQKLATKDRSYQVAVELEVAGNIWGIPSPPADWFPAQTPDVSETANSGRELRVVTRKDQPLAPTADKGTGRVSSVERNDAAAPPFPPLAQFMVGLAEQIQTMASDAATAALVQEKSRFLEELRGQLRHEAVKAVQSVISASKEVITRRAAEELNQAHESGARTNYAVWMKKVEQDMESARQHLLAQGKEVSQRIDSMAVSTIERVQRNMETTRSEAVDKFVSRLRDQVAPLLAEAKDSIQKLAESEIIFKKESQAIYAGLETQLESTAYANLAKAQEELEKSCTAIAAKTNETLLRLYQKFEKAAQDNLQSLLGSLGGQLNKLLEQRASEISREFSAGLEGYTRTYLESIGKSIAEIPRSVPGPSRP
jgi:ribosomal protein S20